MDELSKHALARTVLAQARPDDQIIPANRADARRILVAVNKRIHAHGRAANARAGKCPRVNVPTVGRVAGSRAPQATMKLPSAAAATPGSAQGLESVFTRNSLPCRHAIAVVKPRVNIHAGRTDHRRRRPIGVVNRTQIKSRPFLFRHPGDDKPAVCQRRDGRRALVVGGELIDQKFAADFWPAGERIWP